MAEPLLARIRLWMKLAIQANRIHKELKLTPCKER